MPCNSCENPARACEEIDRINASRASGVEVAPAPDLRAALEQCRNALLALGGISHVPMAREAVDAANRALGVKTCDGGQSNG